LEDLLEVLNLQPPLRHQLKIVRPELLVTGLQAARQYLVYTTVAAVAAQAEQAKTDHLLKVATEEREDLVKSQEQL
jgi:hypothetical protein